MSEQEASAGRFRIVNGRGLHARAAAKFVKLASGFRSEVTVAFQGMAVSGHSIMGLLMLAAGPGSVLEIRTEGPDAVAALAALGALITSGFDEDRDAGD